MSPRVLASVTTSAVVAALLGLLLTGWALHRSGPAPTTDGLPPLLQRVDARVVVESDPVPTSARTTVDPVWAAATSAATRIPRPAVAAYGTATLTVRADDPGCRLGWTTLAGIGWIESQHGTLDGRTVGPDGRSDRVVLGPALDGRGPVAAVRPRPGWARWHGDVRWEHAVGPMQFLGSSWAAYGSDADGDGHSDPTDLDDAALAAARLLCDASDLDGTEAWTRSILAYNRSSDYVLDVFTAAELYAQEVR